LRSAAQEVGHRCSGGRDGRLGTTFGGGDAAPVGDPAGQRGGDCLADLARHLRAARTVEEGRAVGEGGEVAADAVDVECHGAILARSVPEKFYLRFGMDRPFLSGNRPSYQ
jgi:hypothetical protein